MTVLKGADYERIAGILSHVSPPVFKTAWLCGRSSIYNILLGDLDAVAKPKKPLYFVIVGAGLAGLFAAYDHA